MIPARLALLYRFSERSIRDDAAKGVHTCEERIRGWLSAPRPYAPLKFTEHQRLAEAENCDAEIQERKAALEEQEKLWASQRRVGPLVLGAAAMFLVECLSAIGIFVTRGEPMPERLIYGFGLAAGVFALLGAVIAFGETKTGA